MPTFESLVSKPQFNSRTNPARSFNFVSNGSEIYADEIGIPEVDIAGEAGWDKYEVVDSGSAIYYAGDVLNFSEGKGPYAGHEVDPKRLETLNLMRRILTTRAQKFSGSRYTRTCCF